MGPRPARTHRGSSWEPFLLTRRGRRRFCGEGLPGAWAPERTGWAPLRSRVLPLLRTSAEGAPRGPQPPVGAQSWDGLRVLADAQEQVLGPWGEEWPSRRHEDRARAAVPRGPGTPGRAVSTRTGGRRGARRAGEVLVMCRGHRGPVGHNLSLDVQAGQPGVGQGCLDKLPGCSQQSNTNQVP